MGHSQWFLLIDATSRDPYPAFQFLGDEQELICSVGDSVFSGRMDKSAREASGYNRRLCEEATSPNKRWGWRESKPGKSEHGGRGSKGAVQAGLTHAVSHESGHAVRPSRCGVDRFMSSSKLQTRQFVTYC